jgi:hypothetical protein
MVEVLIELELGIEVELGAEPEVCCVPEPDVPVGVGYAICCSLLSAAPTTGARRQHGPVRRPA